MLSVSLNLKNRSVLLVGGGVVAARRAEKILAEGAQVIVIAPEINERLRSFVADDQLIWKERLVEVGDLKDVFLVILATDQPQLNDFLDEVCQKKGILCNHAGDSSRGSVHMMATFSKKHFDVAVGTRGQNPRHAKLVSEYLEQHLADHWGEILNKDSNA